MTPFEIRILLHYYTASGDAEEVLRNPPILETTMKTFVELGLLEHSDGRGPGSFIMTPKGNFYVERGLMDVPVPVECYKFPEAE